MKYLKQGVLFTVLALLILFVVFVLIAPDTSVTRDEALRPALSDNALSAAAVQTASKDVVCTVRGSDFVLIQNATVADDAVCLEREGVASCQLTVPEDGTYCVLLEVQVESVRPVDNLLTLTVGEQSWTVVLPTLWMDASTEYAIDRFGNETIPEQAKYDGFVTDVLRLNSSRWGDVLTLTLPAGEHSLKITNDMDPVSISSIHLIPDAEPMTYADYQLLHPAMDDSLQLTIHVEGENYAAKSDSYISPASADNALLYPYNNQYDLINILSGSSWADSGQQVTWEIQAPANGWYAMQFVYGQTSVEDMSSFRTIRVDGEVPYAELQNVAFPYTRYTYDVMTPSAEDGTPLKVYLTAGEHTLTLVTTVAPYREAIQRLDVLMTQIRELSLTIKKVTGNSTDRYRTWNMEEFVPGITENLAAMADEVDSVYALIAEVCGREPSFASTLQVASANLRMLADDPDELPGNMAVFSDGTSSVSQRLADVNDSLLNQTVDLDSISFYAGDAPKKREATVFQTIRSELMRFLRSFSSQSQGYSATAGKESENLVVWMNRPLQYVTLLQQMVDAEFTAQTGIGVELYIMPNESKLVLSNAAGTTPDVALSVANQTPYNLALRGAAHPLSDFPDFYDYLREDYNLSAYSGLVLDNKVWGALETSDFYVMVYRKDILDSLGLEIPQTWDDVIGMMPKLQRYGMNFYTPLAGNKGSKYLHETTPYLFQAGAALLAADGMQVDFTSEKAYRGFELMTDLYLKYSLSQDTPNFYNHFRYGTAPIGIINYSTYILLENAAPEIADQWEMTLVPGTIDEDGVIHRYQVAGDKSDLIFADSEKKEEAWEFLKWWLSADVQLEYANRLMMNYGPEYFWNTANMDAFAQYPIDAEHIETILVQWKEHTREMQKHPATYMIEREISNVWSAVVVNGADLRTTLVQSETIVNREIEVKLKEFGYVVDGELVEEYPVLTDEELLMMFSDKREGK